MKVDGGGAVGVMLILVAGPAASAQQIRGDTATVIPHAEFKAGGLHRFLWGNGYREMWTKPIRVATADLGRIGGRGGVEAVERGPGHESRPFMFRAQDGRTFGFRSLVKDPTLEWPERLRTGTLRSIGQDQISGTVPGGGLVVARFDRAVGVLDAGGVLVVLPDDPRLGEWRTEFAHALGTLEPRWRDSTVWLSAVPGAREFASTEDLFKRLRTDPASCVDQARFLAARLIDLLVGDWDRHGKQWTWARFDERGCRRWAPISSDRDWAFDRNDGLLWGLARLAGPQFQKFNAGYAGWKGLLIRSRPIDRRLLTGLGRSTWDSVVGAITRQLNDPRIDAALATLPAGVDSASLQWLRGTLKQRRDRLPEIAGQFYLQLAGVVEVWATDSGDRIGVDREPDGRVTVSVVRGSGTNRWSRRFVPGETKEVRIYTLGGMDSVSIGPQPGDGTGPIRVRIIRGDETGVKRPGAGEFFSSEEMFRDWGSSRRIAPWIAQHTGVGIVLGGGPVFTRYGFGRTPYASRIGIRSGYTTGTHSVNTDVRADFRFGGLGLALQIRAQAYPGDAIHYFGIGNETERTEPRAFYILHQRTYRFEPRLVAGLGSRTSFSLGATARVAKSDLDRETLAAAERPYGFGSFRAVGGLAGVDLDFRNDRAYPTLGIRVQLNGRYFPFHGGDITESFGVVEGVVSAYLGTKTLPGQPVLALRGGGAKGWGTLPFLEAPSLGGQASIRGYSTRRYLGDRLAYGGAELRFNFGDFKVLVPGEWGLYALADRGRVYLQGETSDQWHSAVGGGIWVAVADRRAVFSLSYAHGESNRIYTAAGYHF